MNFDFTKEPGKKLLKRDLNTAGSPLVSIITPFYNAGKYFEQTYNCVMNQTFPWFEWIIVDDGSTDALSKKILDDASSSDPRIKIIYQSNGGPAKARNTAIKNSNTDIIIPLDADDLIVPNYIDYVYWGLYFNPDASWCYTDSVGFFDKEYLWKQPFSSERMKKENILTCTAAIRKSALLAAGLYNDKNNHYDEDWHLWLNLLSMGKYPVHLSSFSFWYRRTPDGMLSTKDVDAQLKKASSDIIQNAARNVDISVTAKEYPSLTPTGCFVKPKLSDFKHKVYKCHNKIQLLLIIPWMEMGGADLFNLEIVKKLDRDRFNITIITTNNSNCSWRQLFEEYVADIFELPSFLDHNNYAEFISYIIKSREIDVLFLSNSYYGYYILPWLRKNFPDLAIIDYVHMEEWYWRNGGYARTTGALGEITEKTYVCNEQTRQVLINSFNRKPESVETLYIGADKAKFDETKVDAGQVRKLLDISSERPIVLFPCRIHPQKRPFLMLAIAKRLKEKLPEIAFVVVGDGPQLDEMKEKSDQLGLTNTVYFAGRQTDMLPFYKDAHITLICSLKEGLALTAYESLAMGTPVVTSDVGGQAELIDSSVGAVLPLMQCEEKDLDSREFPEEEINQYVNAILNIISDQNRYADLCKACRKRIDEKFSSDIMIEKLQGIFADLVENEEKKLKRRQISSDLNKYPSLIDDYCTLYCEIMAYEGALNNMSQPQTVIVNQPEMKRELIRIANSKWGRRILKVALFLKINKLFK